jgi:aryl-alcohol dehydrogenase-like predicted oxidoreductase
MPFQFGLLTGKVTGQTTFPPTDHRSFRLVPELLAEAAGSLQEIGAIASRLGVSPASLALGYCASYPEVSTVIPGIRTPEQAEGNAAPARIEPVTQARLECLYEEKLKFLVERMQKLG